MLVTLAHLYAALIVFVLSVALIDCYTHRIPNLLCAAATALGLIWQMLIHGEAGLLSALGGAAVGFGMFLPFYVMRAFGAGDVKAMTTVGIFLGAQATALAVGMTLVVGGVIGALVLWRRPAQAGGARQRWIGLPAARSSQRFPYGIAIACGTAVALLVLTH